MIVKDESHIIRKTLEHLKKYISFWVISDTGSTDNTKEIVEEFFKENEIPGSLVEHEWEDFGTNRTLALEACFKHRRKFDYIWVFDADDLIVGDLNFPENMTKDGYSVKYGNEFRYMRMQLFKSSEKWRYVGVLHEYPECVSKKNILKGAIDGDYYIDSRRIGARNKVQDKYQRDAKILLKGLDKEPNNSRYMFYLAQSYMDARDYDKAIEWYRKRVEKGGWFEEVYYSYYRIATCLFNKKEDWDKVEKAHMDAWKYLPSRAEPLYEIAKYCRINRMFEKGYKYAKLASTIPYPKDQVLFIFKSIYDYQILDELSICAYYVGRHEENIEICQKLLKEKLVPQHHFDRIISNMVFSQKSLLNKKKENESNKVSPTKRRLSIGLMSTLVNDKYKGQILGCEETWVKEAQEHFVPVIYFCGDIEDDEIEKQVKNIVHLQNVKDDYSSATFKQYYGFRYLLKHHPADFYLIAGSDNYINIDRCLKMLEKYNSKYPFLIGGHGENRQIFGYSSHYMTGGAGLFLSHSALTQLEPNFDDFIQEYAKELKTHKDKDACDVSLCHFSRRENVTLVKEKDLYYCDWKGKCWSYDEFPCGGINYDKMIICHYMEREDMLLYDYWKDRNIIYGKIFRKVNKYLKANLELPLIVHYYSKSCSTILQYGKDVNLSFIFLKGLMDNLNTDVRELIVNDINEEVSKIVKNDNNIHYGLEKRDQYDLIYLHFDMEDLEQLYQKIKCYLLIVTKDLTNIHKFIENHPDIIIENSFTFGNGLTILKKI